MHTCKMQKKRKTNKIGSSDTFYIFHTGEETVWAPMMLCTYSFELVHMYIFCLFVNNCQRNCQRSTFTQIFFFFCLLLAVYSKTATYIMSTPLSPSEKICVLNWNIEPIRLKWLWTGLGWQRQAYSGAGNPIFFYNLKKIYYNCFSRSNFLYIITLCHCENYFCIKTKKILALLQVCIILNGWLFSCNHCYCVGLPFNYEFLFLLHWWFLLLCCSFCGICYGSSLSLSLSFLSTTTT